MADQFSAAIRWHGDCLELLDQRKLPAEEQWLACQSSEQVSDAIRQMVVRGAPAIGISAAYGIALAARALGERASLAALAADFDALAASRPTAVNLFWALDSMRRCGQSLSGNALVEALSAHACHIHADDVARNRAIGTHGAALLPVGKAVYTHCNTGALATGGHGTALGIIRSAHEQGTLPHVYAGETRPWLQGARLTAWELQRDGIPVTLVVDSCAGHLMARGDVGAVIVGADRITANGDTANKIGTYGLAVLARHHGIPFIVAAPCSTIDLSLASGDAIAIEERDSAEITALAGQPIAAPGVDAFNPAFDVTPASLVTAIVTERGVIREPDDRALGEHMRD
jgi:methylthioribose-1-phosphate isomerase